MTTPSARAWIEIDADAIAHNARTLRRAIPAGTRLGLMVKANGYGHGLIPAAQAALEGGCDRLMVVSIEEALQLRSAGVTGPILIVYTVPRDAVEAAVDADVELSVSGPDATRRTLDAWRPIAARHPDARLRLHLEIDSGMGRSGLRPGNVGDAIAAVVESPRVDIVGIWTHLADGSDARRSAEQIAVYDAASRAGIDQITASARPAPIRHVAATEGLVCETAPSLDMVRIGLGLYGELGVDVVPTSRMQPIVRDLRPAMTVKVRPIRVEDLPVGASVGYGGEWTAARPSRIATLPIGYADGWTRRYWPGAVAIVRGRRVPLVGRVSMDSVCADVTDVPGVDPDDEVVLLGAQGDERISAVDLARLRGSIPNEVFCAFGPRLPRVVVHGTREDAWRAGEE